MRPNRKTIRFTEISFNKTLEITNFYEKLHADYGYIIKILILYYQQSKDKIIRRKFKYAYCQLLFYSQENDRIISKIISYSMPKYIEFFQLTPEHLQKTINKILLFNFINPLRPQIVYGTSL
jgi:hypothetical protein